MTNAVIRSIKTALPILIIMGGIVLLLYPWVSNYLFENRKDSLIEIYQKEVEDTKEESKDEMILLAQTYNQMIYETPVKLTDPFTMNQIEEGLEINYENILKINKTGMMGMIEIPKISVNLPIYHGTSDSILEKGIGHLQGTSFPVGGKNTHAVLTGHTGLNYAKMFTDLTSLEKGDYFFLNILGEQLAYKVNQIEIVLPNEVDNLYIEKGMDLVTLITCTPYGINDHRLFVTGERTEYKQMFYEEENKKEVLDTMWMRSYTKAILIGLIITPLAILVLILCRSRFIK